jgi:hypothetical protein
MIGNTMTPARRRRKPGRLQRGTAGAVLAGAALLLALPLGAQTTEQVVVDRHTGLAILGFDAVAYFTDGAAILGKSEHEYGFAGAVWRFRNAGNRGAFIANPGVYGPRFGGYDPVGLARGVGVAGNPLLWLIVEERLYLFYDGEARATFAAGPARLIAAAEKNWPIVLLSLSP